MFHLEVPEMWTSSLGRKGTNCGVVSNIPASFPGHEHCNGLKRNLLRNPGSYISLTAI